MITKAAIIATKMNNFFIKKVKDIRANIPFLPSSLGNCYKTMKGRKVELELQHVSINKVLRILKKMKASKSTGIDTLDGYSVKISADIIAQPLHHIICLSIMQQKFPSDWKYS